jgi:hypothetical protein
MQDDISLELQRLIEIFGREEADEAGQTETDAAFLQQVEIWQRDSGAPEELPDGEIDAELLQEIADWQRDEAENEPARIKASQVEARELNEFVKRVLADDARLICYGKTMVKLW